MSAQRTSVSEAGDESATVLVVDDEPSLADLYANWLSARYDVRTAYGGEEALAAVDEGEVDVVLLDRRMPKLSGDEVLKHLRERGHELPVAMVTAVDPGLELTHMPCQGYLVKSVEQSDLFVAVEHLLQMAEYDRKRRELSAMQVRREVLEAELSRRELHESESFQQLKGDIEALKRELSELSEEFGDETEST